jgi:DNA-binding transcriptional ArsR family regulator
VDVFEVVAEPNRRRLLDLLDGGDRSAGELVTGLPGLTQPAVSRHLRILRESGLVEARTEGQRRIYTLWSAATAPRSANTPRCSPPAPGCTSSVTNTTAYE